MSKKQNSKNHHWWPVALQKEWQDKNGKVSWITPEGKVESKMVHNRNVGKKRYGHTSLRNTDFEYNFEPLFDDVDNSIPETVCALKKIQPLGKNPTEVSQILSLLFKKNRGLEDLCKYHNLDEELHRNLLKLIFSILIRSPAYRDCYERFPMQFGLQASEEVGKGNMQKDYNIASGLCDRSSLHCQSFVIIHAPPFKSFLFGDGNLDCLTGMLAVNRISGKALICLTPKICVFFCTPTTMQSNKRCASFTAANWQVDAINSLVQIYSKTQLFFIGRPPTLNESFKQKMFLQHKIHSDSFLDSLQNLSSESRFNTFTNSSFYFD